MQHLFSHLPVKTHTVHILTQLNLPTFPLYSLTKKNNNPKIADINKIVPTVKLVLTFKMLIQIKIMENKNNKNFGHGVVFSVKTACQLLKR